MKRKQHLMPIHKIIVLMALSIGGIGLSLAIFLSRIDSTKPKNDFKTPTREYTNAASPEFDYLTSVYGQAIQHAQTYLIDNLDSIIPDHRLILDYLQRKYGLNPRFSAQNSPINSPVKGSTESPTQFDAFKRIAYPNELVSTLPPAKDDLMTQMMMAAMQCDHIPLSLGFNELVQTNIKSGGYNLTHVEFSLQRLKENRCQYFTASQEQAILDNTAGGMVKLIQASETKPDLRYEALAFLLDMDRSDLVQPAWMRQIIADQQSDGSWETQNDKNSGNDNHTTILALWALLEYTRPNAPNEPMIRRPS